MSLRFRMRAGDVQVSRLVTDRDRKETSLQSLGSISMSHIGVPKGLRTKLMEAECQQLEEYIAELVKVQKIRDEATAKSIQIAAMEASRYAETIDDPNAIRDLLKNFREAIGQLQRTIRHLESSASSLGASRIETGPTEEEE